MRRAAATVVVIVLVAGAGHAPGVIGVVLAGKQVKPKVGAWAWYDVKDAATGQAFVLRLAIVGEKEVLRKQGYWLEVEVVPLVGYRSVYKMLLTGPADDPVNVHQFLQREGRDEVVEVALEKPSEKDAAGEAPNEETEAKEPKRTLLGCEDVKTEGGVVPADRYELLDGERQVEIWLNEDVRPMGLVRLKSATGQLMLRHYGVGGQDARSVIHDPPVPGVEQPEAGVKVEVRVDRFPHRVGTEGDSE